MSDDLPTRTNAPLGDEPPAGTSGPPATGPDPALTRVESAGAVTDADSATTRPDPPPPGIPAAPPGYVFERELGHGAMGVVYQAWQVRLNRTAAVKMPLSGRADQRALIRFLAEAEAVAAIHHPHVVQVYDFGEHDGRPFLALEFLSGGSLADRLKGAKPLPAADAAGLLAKLSDGVQAAHDRGIVHRDIKPANILFDEYGAPKVTDFGLAKRGEGTDLTATQAVMGTPAYMAPEQAAGDTKFVGPAADVYALGVILYECLTGSRPHKHTDTLALLRLVAEAEPDRLRSRRAGVPRDLELICHKCLEKAPHKRYQTAGELAADLRRFLAGEPVQARPRPAPERLARWVRRHPTLAATVACLVVATAALFAVGAVHNARLQTALDDARAGWAAADDHAQKAEAQRRAAEDGRLAVAGLMKDREHAFDEILDGFDTRLENFDGTEMIHREFLADQATAAERMLAATPDDPVALLRAAKISRRAADAAAKTTDHAAADQKYARAVELYARLIARDPAPEHRLARADATYRWAAALQAGARRPDAAKRFAEAAELYTGLPDSAAASATARPSRRGARARYHAAELTAVARPADAVAAYRDVLARQTALLEKEPDDADLLEDVGLTASGLALALEATDPAGAEAAHRRAITAFTAALAAEQKAAAGKPSNDDEPGTAVGRRLKREQLDAYSDLARFLEARGRDADLLAYAREYLKALSPDPSGNAAYNAACYAARAVGIARRNGRPTAELAAAACKLFADATAAGFDDRVHLAVDADLDPIRDEPAFRATLAQLDKEAGGRPPTAAEIVRTLRALHRTRRQFDTEAKSEASGFTELRRAARPGWEFPVLAGYALRTAAARPDPATAVPLFAWVAEAAGTAKAPPAELARFKQAAVDGLRGHVGKKEFGAICRELAECGSAEIDELLAAASAEAGQPTTTGRGLAAYWLAVSKAKQAELAPVGTPEQQRLLDEAEEQFARVVSEFKGVNVTGAGGSPVSLSAAAEAKRYEVAHLYPGRAGPPVSGPGLDGGPAIDLREHRGKVVVVAFWANWCGICRGIFPAQRQLVSAHAGKPFVMIGVNADRDRQAAVRAVTNHQLNWRSVYDGPGGPVCDAYRVEGYPCFFLLDADGVIRKRWRGRPNDGELEKAVAAVLTEPSRATAASAAPAVARAPAPRPVAARGLPLAPAPHAVAPRRDP